ncbi:MAG: lantibiotic dehydratase [Pseudonocardiaceae bacterium]
MRDPLFRAWGVFLVRAPLLAVAGGVSAAAAPDPTPADGRPGYLELIRTVSADARLVEAVNLATPSLGAVLDQVRAGQIDRLRDTQLRRAALALLRYDIRMRTRPTPFGLFAGVCCGEFGGAAKFEYGRAHRTRTHVDMGWLSKIVHRLERDSVLLAALRLRTHQALVARGDRITLEVPSTIGAAPGENSRSAVSVRNSPVVRDAVRAARTPILFEDLVTLLRTRFGTASREQVAGLLRALVSQEILLTDLRPSLAGSDPLSHVIDVLAAAPHRAEDTDRMLDELRAVDRLRSGYDGTAPGQGHAQLGELIRRATALQPHDHPLHVDIRLDLHVQLPQEVRTEAERMIEVLWRLSPPRLGMRPLRGYHHRFLERYGVDRLVPLLELLDDTSGLGAPPGYEWPPSEAAAEPPAEPDSATRDRLLSALCAAAVRDRRREIVLDDATVAELAYDQADPADLPNSCELYLHVVAPSLDELTAGTFRIVLSPSPGSHHAGATVARFADLLPEWADQLADEQRNRPVHIAGALSVDLAFAPRAGRAANLAHAIAHTGRRISVGLPDAAGVTEIPLSEIAIGANLERLCAVHLPTGREIVPVLPNMVSPAVQAPNVTRLLYELGMEGQRLWEPWNWGPMAHCPFLPRIRYGRAVLAPATWRLDELRDSAGDWSAAVSRWRQAWAVPRHLLVVSNDQRLLLDLDDPWHRELLHDETRRDVSLVAQEVPGDAEGWLAGGTGGHTVEVVVPLARRDPTPRRPPHLAYLDPGRQAEGLGGGWLYLKIYGARRTQDDLLREQIPQLVAAAAEGGADRWFFIRYTDSDGHHVRLRLHGESDRLWSGVARTTGAMLLDWQRQGLVSAHQVDQYAPELERYGGTQAQQAAEELFERDSAAAVALLRLVKSSGCPYSLDALVAISVAALAHAFGPPSPQAPPSPQTQWLSAEYAGEAAAAWLSLTGSRRDLPGQYRKQAAYWRRLLDPAGGWSQLRAGEVGSRVLAALADRDEAVRTLARHVRSGSRTPQARVVGSLLHMTCNRLVGGSADRESTILGIARGAVQDNFNRRRHLT